ncbi:citrate/2-methylcitrate synthase [Pseudogracilibacillus sp. SE30717A]|uniref:citrate/2-methylcitrate synthase n=1 Tax=Pseudogracilibacillus sp. SE30717A TaxID=3098293 RepID=UPI00300DC9E2
MNQVSNRFSSTRSGNNHISLVDGKNGRLIYRGINTMELAVHYTFEEVCYLIWNSTLPSKEELITFKEKMYAKRRLPKHILNILENLPSEMEFMSILRTCISALGSKNYTWKPTLEQAIEITSVTPTIIAYIYRKKRGMDFIPPSLDKGHVENYIYMLTGEIPREAQVKALNAYLILTMEQGVNASTFAARVITSTESEMVSAVTGAIGAMKGSLHGGAPSKVIEMLNKIGDKENAELWLRCRLECGQKIMGFGHYIYKAPDPRALALREVTRSLLGQNKLLDLAYFVEQTVIRLLKEYKPGRKIYTNVEFYAAAVLRAVDIPEILFTPTYTASRIVGWTANILDQSKSRKLFNPQVLYEEIFPK